MIDTLRLHGEGRFFKFKPNLTKYFVTKNDSGEERANLFEFGKTGTYRAFYSPPSDAIATEFNVSKILFGENVHNWGNSFLTIDKAIRACESYFFSRPCYVARIDLGFVQTFESPERAHQVLEMFRGCRLPASRLSKYKHQNYSNSVFYYTKNWSIKIYNKGAEMKINPLESRYIELNSTLRFEKTYRFNELKRLGMKTVPTKGVLLRDLDTVTLLGNFWSTFENWEFMSKPYLAPEGQKGMQYLLNVLDNQGILTDVEAEKKVSQSTMWRYRKTKKMLGKVENPVIQYRENLTQLQKNRLNHFFLFPEQYF